MLFLGRVLVEKKKTKESERVAASNEIATTVENQNVRNQIRFSTDWRYDPEMVFNRNWIQKKM